MDTARVLDGIGVSTLRSIRTTETARWRTNAPDSYLSIEKYYEKMLEFANAYKDSGMGMQVIIWQLMRIVPSNKTYSLDPVKTTDGKNKPSTPICKGNRGMVGVTSSGDVVPCLQMSGYFEEHGMHMGNLHNTPLKELLSEGRYLDSVCMQLHQKLAANPKCRGCEYWGYCSGGCPAPGLLFTGELTGSDITKCLFFEKGWYRRSVAAMLGWENMTEIKTGPINN